MKAVQGAQAALGTGPLRKFAGGAAAIIALALTMSGPLAGAAPAAAQSERPPVPVVLSLDSMSPAAPRVKGKIILSGKLNVTGTASLDNSVVSLRISRIPISDRAELASLVAGQSERLGEPVAGVEQAMQTSLAPGTEQAWTLKTPVTDLGLATPGVYALIVSLAGTVDGVFGVQSKVTTYLPWFPQRLANPSRLVLGWPVMGVPARNADGVLLDEKLPQSLEAGGRLSRLVSLASGANRKRVPLSWLVDPDLLATVEEMTKGYRVVTGSSPDPAPGAKTDQARDWLETARQTMAPADVHALPIADPDVLSLLGADLGNNVVKATTPAAEQASKALGRSVEGGLAWAPGGNLDSEGIDLWQSAGITSLILSSAAQPPIAAAFTPSGSGKLPASRGPLRTILYDDSLAATLAASTWQPGEAVAVRQAFLADTALINAELPDVPRTVVALPPKIWDPAPEFIVGLLNGLARARWIKVIPLGQALTEPVSDVLRVKQPLSQEELAAGLGPNFTDPLRRSQQDLSQILSISDVADPEMSATMQQPQQALLRGGSALWRERRGRGLELAASNELAIDRIQDKVRIISTGVVTFPGETGRIPITIANDLDSSISVGVRILGVPKVRLDADEIEPVVVGPRRKISVEATGKLIGTGKIPVKLQLVSAQGKKYGEPATIELRTTAYSQAALWVVGGAFGLLVLLLAANGLRRHRERRRRNAAESSSSPGPAPDVSPSQDAEPDGTDQQQSSTSGPANGENA